MPVMMSWRMKTTCSPMDSPSVPRQDLGRGRPGVEPLDHVAVLGQDRGAPDLVGARELVVVRVQLLVEQRELADTRRLGQPPLPPPRPFPPPGPHLGSSRCA